MTYNSNHIEGNRLTHDQTRYIFETNTIGVENEVLNVDGFNLLWHTLVERNMRKEDLRIAAGWIVAFWM